jgi:hypothetical protein
VLVAELEMGCRGKVCISSAVLHGRAVYVRIRGMREDKCQSGSTRVDQIDDIIITLSTMQSIGPSHIYSAMPLKNKSYKQ